MAGRVDARALADSHPALFPASTIARVRKAVDASCVPTLNSVTYQYAATFCATLYTAKPWVPCKIYRKLLSTLSVDNPVGNIRNSRRRGASGEQFTACSKLHRFRTKRRRDRTVPGVLLPTTHCRLHLQQGSGAVAALVGGRGIYREVGVASRRSEAAGPSCTRG